MPNDEVKAFPEIGKLAATKRGAHCVGLHHVQDFLSRFGYVGGLAAQSLRQEMGSAGVIASDFLPRIPLAMRDLRGESRPESSGAVRPDLLQMLQSASGQQG